MSAESITDELLRVTRQQFYPDDAEGFQEQRNLLLKAITYPASWLQARGVALSEAEYKKMIHERIQEIKRHGATSEIRYYGRYFFHCIQQHMKHQGDKYYQAGKASRNSVEKAMSTLKAAARPVEDTTVERLAEVHAILARKPLPKATPSDKTQLSFL